MKTKQFLLLSFQLFPIMVMTKVLERKLFTWEYNANVNGFKNIRNSILKYIHNRIE